MAQFIERVWLWFILLWDKKRPEPELQEPEPDPIPEPEPEPVPEPEPEPAPPPKAAKAVPKTRASDVYGQFYFREQILDQLDEYFKIVRRMRKYDPTSYALYSRIGAHIMPWDEKRYIDFRELSGWWRANRPAFGAVAFVHPRLIEVEKETAIGDPKGGFITPRFMYFTKYACGRAPPSIQRVTQGDIYIVTAYWTDPKRPNYSDIPEEFPIVITPSGEVQALKTHLHSRIRIRSRKGDFHIPQNRWGINSRLREWAAEHKEPVEEFLHNVFCMAASVYETAQYSMIRIDVRQESMHAVFGVDVRRTPYFFRDRAVTIGDHGHRKRIFHIVRAHTRENGAFIKTHFRGERIFDWNGYHVMITVPGKHHKHIPEFNIGATDAEKLLPGMLGQGHLGYRLQQHIAGKPLERP